MPDHQPPLYPLRFKPIYKEKVWGGRRMEQLGRQLPAGDPLPMIGESWELADLATTSASGGGGNPEHSVVNNGPLAGQTINNLIASYGKALVGDLPLSPEGGFPILIKFLDANDNLSVQVHPSPDYAAKHEDAFLKSEAWYIVACDENACIYKGVKEGTTPDQFREAIANNTVEELMIRVPVKPGDCHYLPSGTCHALGAGVLVAEVQTPSDTTFRVYDWGRTGRELHVEQALECIHYGPAQSEPYEKRSHIAGMFTSQSRLVTCEYFNIEKVRMSEGYEQEIPYDQPTVWMVVEGKGSIIMDGSVGEVSFERGQTLLVPAELPGAKVKLTEDTAWLEVTFPQASKQTLA